MNTRNNSLLMITIMLSHEMNTRNNSLLMITIMLSHVMNAWNNSSLKMITSLLSHEMNTRNNSSLMTAILNVSRFAHLYSMIELLTACNSGILPTASCCPPRLCTCEELELVVSFVFEEAEIRRWWLTLHVEIASCFTADSRACHLIGSFNHISYAIARELSWIHFLAFYEINMGTSLWCVCVCVCVLSLIHIWRCRRGAECRSRWSPYH